MIDWTKPIEAVHEATGEVVAITDAVWDEPDYRTMLLRGGMPTYFMRGSGIAAGTGWRARNVEDAA